jgi:hypothetical protein
MNRLVALAFTVALVVPWDAAEATGFRIGGGVGAVRERIHSHSPRQHQGLVAPWQPDGAACRDHGGRWTCVNPPAPRDPRRPHDHVIIVPQPIYIAPSQSCHVPGYWTYQWVPQTFWQTVYVPGYWAADGTWVQSHYAQQPYATGTYHPVWVPEQWAC